MPGTVTVALKLPNGLVLELKENKELGLKGRPEVYVARGSALPYGVASEFSIVGGFGLTPNIDADFFAEWLVRNANLSVVKEGLIFAHAKASDASVQAREFAELRSGLEALDPEKPGTGLERVPA